MYLQIWQLYVSVCIIWTAAVSSLNLYKDDIIVPNNAPSDYVLIANEKQAHRNRRHVKRMKQYLWLEKKIPYEISPELERYSYLIYSAMEEIEKTTCILFISREYWHQHFIEFQLGEQCSSNIGKIYWENGGQRITLGLHCMQKVTILHELMHSLGFLHEHTRYDRYKYVEILWENIIKGEEKNFEPDDHFLTDTLNIKYDFNSILHYDNYAFSSNQKPTIRRINMSETVLGNKKGLSVGDIMRINKIYDCPIETPNRMKRRLEVSYLSHWATWSPCNQNCVKYRQRVCFGQQSQLCYGMNKYGVQTEMVYCSDKECYAPVAGHWGRWSEWNNCVLGKQERLRECNNPKAKYNGNECIGINKDIRQCDNSPFNVCKEPLGLENNRIPDDNLKASYSLDVTTQAYYGRLNSKRCWCGTKDNKNQFFQVKLLKFSKITNLAIQGHPYLSFWISSFRLLYKDKNNWNIYKENSEQAKIFTVEKKNRIMKQITLKNLLEAEYIAINPIKWYGTSPCLRIELYGCEL